MICAEFERLVAEGAGETLERHLGECATCRELTGALREIGQNQISDAALVAVRAGVLERLGRRRRFGWWWWMPAAAAAALAVWLVLLAWPRPAAVAPPQIVWRTPAAPPVRMPVARRVARKRRPAPARAPVMVASARPAQRITIKMITDNPKIVVYWIVEPEEKGEAR
jgi:hypothetical protein